MNCNREDNSHDVIPLKSQCFTPAVTPSTSYYDEESDESSQVSYAIYTEKPISPANPCSSSSSLEVDTTPCFKITVKDPSPAAADCPPPPLFEDQNLSLRATITNEEDAVEVTLNLSSLYIDSSHIDDRFATPQSYQATPSPSLSDKQEQQQIINNFAADAFHSSPQTPVRLNFCGMQDWCDPNSTELPLNTNCGGENHFCVRADDNSQQQQQQQQRAVEEQIWQSLGEGWCHPWQATYSTDISPTKRNNKEPLHQRTTKRRVFDLAARRTRLATLRRDLNPFTLNATTPPQRYPFGKSHSFNLSSTTTKVQNNMKNQELVPVWECGTLDCTEPKHDSPATIRLRWEEECHGYDSDPEDYPKENVTVASVPQSLASDNLVDFMNDRVTLIQHCNGTSVAVQAWIERGQKLRDQTILPKLVWKRLHSNQKSVVHQRFELSSIDLLDICRILPVDQLDRDKCPFAVKSRAFSIRTIQQEPIIFEAQSNHVRDRFMCNLKHTISRLAAKILTRDPSTVEEFFAEESAEQPFLPQRLQAWV